MKYKTDQPKPLVVLRLSKNNITEIYVLDKDDSMPWNSSTHYDHHMTGPSIITRNISRGESKIEYYVNDPKIWGWIESLMRLGIKYLEEHPDFDNFKFQEELKKEYENRKPYESIHK